MNKNMFNFILIFIVFFTDKLFSAEIEILSNSRVKYSELIFTDKSKYMILNQIGQWTDSIGNYGSSKCKGLIKKDNKDKVSFLDVICEFTDQNDIITWRKYDRVGSEIQRGVGVSTVIDSTSTYKEDLLGTKCKYAVNRTQDMVFSKSICYVSNELYRKMIK